MPTATYTPLATVTLGSAAASVTFSSIPATYRDLILVIGGGSASGQNIYIRNNGDTGSNYSYVWMVGTGSTTISQSGTRDAATVGSMFNSQGNAIIQLMDYSATDKHKTYLGRSGNAANETFAGASRWANTAAITSMVVFLAGSANWNSATTFSLYGVIA